MAIQGLGSGYGTPQGNVSQQNMNVVKPPVGTPQGQAVQNINTNVSQGQQANSGYYQPAPAAPAPVAPPPAAAAPPPAAPTGPDPRFDLTQPGDYENFYSQHKDDLMGPSASEQLYAEGMAGSNPYYDYAEQQATNSVNAAERARGGYNSGAALAEIGNSSSYLRGQQAHELGQLAGQADTAKLGRYGLTGQMADTSQNHRENRIQNGFQDELALDTAQASPVSGFYSTAGNENQQAQMAAIEAWGKAQGMDAAEIKQLTDMVTSLGGDAIKAAA